MQDSIFRMYDIRGKVGSEFVVEHVYDLVRAMVVYFMRTKTELKTVVVGMDGRTHSPSIKEEVCRALQDCGLQVIFLGICPSPLVYFALHTLSVDAGIMITASHNPKEYNGLKICLGKNSVWGQELQEIKHIYKEKNQCFSGNQGSYSEYNCIPDYIADLMLRFPQLIGLTMPLVIDCGNGATGVIIPALIKAMNWQNITLLYAEIDGNYPHHEADPVVEENMQDVKKVLLSGEAELGIGFDGDGDRMAAMTKDGYLVPGDQTLALLCSDYVLEHPGTTVVCDIKSSSVLLDVITNLGGKAYLSPSGHSLIKKTMRECNAKIGGELSGHFFFYDNYYGYDDAIYAALRLIALLVKKHVALHTLIGQLPKKVSSPEFRIACAEEQKWTIIDSVRELLSKRHDVKMITIDGIRATFPMGTGILRASNTQPVLSLRFEAESAPQLEEVKHIFIQALVPHLDEIFLRRHILVQDKELG